MPDLYYALAARMSSDRLVVITCVAFGLVGAPLLALSLDRGQLYAVALMALAWWPVILLIKFHPHQRPLSTRPRDWFYALLLDALALCVVGTLLLAATTGDAPFIQDVWG